MFHEMFQPQHNFQHAGKYFSQWRNGMRSRDTMIMHEVSACTQDSVHARRRAAKARLSDTNVCGMFVEIAILISKIKRH
jgi:hypothetical protein